MILKRASKLKNKNSFTDRRTEPLIERKEQVQSLFMYLVISMEQFFKADNYTYLGTEEYY